MVWGQGQGWQGRMRGTEATGKCLCSLPSIGVCYHNYHGTAQGLERCERCGLSPPLLPPNGV